MLRKLKKILSTVLVMSMVCMAFTNTSYAIEVSETGQKSEVFDIQQEDNRMKLNWEADMEADYYDIYKAVSRFADYEWIGRSNEAEYIDESPHGNQYANYYKVVAMNEHGISREYAPMSLETELFGENMIFFSDTDKRSEIDAEIARVYEIQKDAQFGPNRYALMFKPGDYTDTAMMQIGFYTHIAGLGKTPLETKIKNIETPAYLSNNNATCNFWRSAENLNIIDTDHNADIYFNFKWAVSQAAPLRRMNVERASTFDWYYGYASGGYVSDSIFRKEAGSWAQQQYYTRNCELKDGFYGVNWNGFFQGVIGAPESNWEEGKGNSNYTNIETTPIIREKPFLYLDGSEYKVFVPALKNDSKGVTWSDGNIGKGNSLSLDEFYIAKADVDNAATMNKALEEGKHIFITPGIYYAEEPIVVKNPNTIILGAGLATIIPRNERAAMIVDDVDGVTIAGIIFDAGSYSDHLLLVGEKDSNKDHSANPTLLADLFFRVGGVHGGVASADIALEVNSNNIIGDHFWIWRADHGDGVAWNLNKSRNGLLVNGDDMTMYGLFNEHFQEYQTLWNGNGGRMYFYQCETPYDPQNQNDWMSHDGTVKGYAAYKVGNKVDMHYAVGLGIYDVFIYTNGTSIFMDNAIEVPNKEGVIVENACIVEISDENGPLVGTNSIVNGTGNGISTGIGGKGYAREFILKYQNGIAILFGNETQEGIQPPDSLDDVKIELKKQILEANSLIEAEYTSNSWKEFKNILNKAQSILDRGNTTKQEVNEVMIELRVAVDQLVKVENIPTQPIHIKIEAEHFNQMKGVDTEPCAEGGENVGWIDSGDWMDYSIPIPVAGTYTMDLRVKGWNKDAKVQVKQGDINLATMNVYTDDVWATVKSKEFLLPAGEITIRIYADEGGFNLNWLAFNSNDSTGETPDPPVTDRINIAQHKTVTTSSNQDGLLGTYAVDGDSDTRWGSNWTDEEWICIDLESEYSISAISLDWEVAAGRKYMIQTSMDGREWVDIYTEENGAQGFKEILFDTTISARYVRMYGVSRATDYGYSLWEMGVYGEKK